MEQITDEATITGLRLRLQEVSQYSILEHIANEANDCITYYRFNKGEPLVKQFSKHDDLYFLIVGEGDIFRADTNGELVKLAVADNGSMLGEMSYIENIYAGSTVLAKNDDTLVLHVCPSLKKRYPTLAATLFDQLKKAYGHKVRYAYNLHVFELQEKLKLAAQKLQFAKLFIFFPIIFSLITLINKVHDKYFSFNVYSLYFRWIYIVLIYVAFFALFDFKLICKKMLPKDLHRELIFAFSSSLLSVAAIFLVQSLDGQYSMGKLITHFFYGFLTIHALSYFGMVVLQQIVRCTVQDVLAGLFYRNAFVCTVASTAYIFAMLHLHLGVLAVLLAFLGGVIFAVYYAYSHSILSVSIYHWFVGLAVFSSGAIDSTSPYVISLYSSFPNLWV